MSNKVIEIRDKGLWSFLSSLRHYINIAKDYSIPFEKEEKEYKSFISRLAA